MKPVEIPESIWEAAKAAVAEIGESEVHDVEPVAWTILAYFRSHQEAVLQKLEKQRYLPSQGIDQEMQCFNDGIDAAIDVIKAPDVV